MTRVAALYDIHANLDALEAVLDGVGGAGANGIVVGGDALLGPMPRETLQRLLDLDLPVEFIHGNCDLALLAQMAAGDRGTPAYWGTTSGAPLSEPLREAYRWVARQLQPDDRPVLGRWPKTLRLEIDGLGPVLFCHGTPRSETEIFTRSTAEERLRPIFDGLGAAVVVCGHTHMQFDRRVGPVRVVNAGSVGAPFGEPGAHWALLGPGVELRRTPYDLARAAERIRATSYPQAREVADQLLHPRSESEMLELFGKAEVSP